MLKNIIQLRIVKCIQYNTFPVLSKRKNIVIKYMFAIF